MNKQQFLDELKNRLNGMNEGDIQKSLEFYSEMIDDSIEDGMTEEQAAASLGNINDIIAQIKADYSDEKKDEKKSEKREALPKPSVPVWAIILLIIGSPLWLLIIIMILIFYLCLWTIVISLYTAALSMFLAGIAGIFSFAFVPGGIPQILMATGIGLISTGLAVLLFFGMNYLSKKIILGTKNFFRWLGGIRK